MTTKDLRAEYQRDTGKYTPNPDDFIIELLDCEEQYALIEYVLWLEEKAIVQNELIEIIKKYSNEL